MRAHTDISTPSMTLWQEFVSLEITSTNLVPTLKALLKSQEDLNAVRELAGPEAQKVVDCINQVWTHDSLTVKILSNQCSLHRHTGNRFPAAN